MIIGGLQKLSLSDYPGHSSCVLFTLGCNFRCGYCHDSEIVLPERARTVLDEREVFDFLKKRVGKLDAVVVCGGEPTLQHDLVEFAKKIKKLGYLLKLDSNGTRPDIIEKLIDERLVDFIAMDIKGPLERYPDIVSRPVNTVFVKRSIDIIMASDVEYEFRTTVVREQLLIDDFHKIGALISGAKRYAIQKFNPKKTLDESFGQLNPYSDEEMMNIQTTMKIYVHKCIVH